MVRERSGFRDDLQKEFRLACPEMLRSIVGRDRILDRLSFRFLEVILLLAIVWRAGGGRWS